MEKNESKKLIWEIPKLIMSNVTQTEVGNNGDTGIEGSHITSSTLLSGVS